MGSWERVGGGASGTRGVGAKCRDRCQSCGTLGLGVTGKTRFWESTPRTADFSQQTGVRVGGEDALAVVMEGK